MSQNGQVDHSGWPHGLPTRRTLLMSGVALGVTGGVAAAKTPQMEKRVSLISPNGRIKFSVVAAGDAPRWSVTHEGEALLAPDILGLIAADGSVIGAGARIVDVRRRSVRDEWRPPYGVQALYPDRAAEMTVSLMDLAQRRLDVVVRCYDRGIAFRYVIPGGSVALAGEATRFGLLETAKVYASRDEGEYQVAAPRALAPEVHPDLTSSSDSGPLSDLPITVVTSRSFMLITESDRLNYPRAMLSPAGAAGGVAIHLMRYPGRATGYSGPGDTPAEPVFSLRPGQPTPWRVVLIGKTAADLIAAAPLIPTLATPNALGDTSWVRPGRAVRIRKPYSTEAALRVVEFAAQRKLEYVEFDAHWYGDGTDPSDATTPIAGLDMQRIIDAARAREIGMILYVDRVPVMTQRDAILDTYEKWGVAGIKFGFVWEGRQSDNNFIYDLVEACGKRRLLVNLHDNLRPAGLERTLPNYVALEGVRGNEQFPTARHNVTLPFTRAIAGPIDYTICYANARNRTTNAHQLAMAAVYYNPLTFLYWYDTPEKYLERPWPELHWFDECPTTWDETRVLSGVIGEHVVIARRHKARWFLGAMTNEIARAVEVDLSFLGDGAWRATRYGDGPRAAEAWHTPVDIQVQSVDRSGRLTLAMAASGGQAILFEPHGG